MDIIQKLIQKFYEIKENKGKNLRKGDWHTKKDIEFMK